MNILVDNRENKRVEYAKKVYKSHNVEVRKLETADYIFNDDVAFEYKRLDDFIQSVQNGRVVEQAIRLNKQFKYPFVIIEGSDNDLDNYLNKIRFLRRTNKKNKPQNFTRKHFYGAINSLDCYVTVKICSTQYWAFYSMLNQAEKCLNGAPINRKVAKTGNFTYNCLRYCVGGVGQKTAEKIVANLGLSTLEDVLNVDISQLSSVKGVSEAKAELIYNKIHN